MAQTETADREQLMQDYLAAWNARDAERIASFFSGDATYDDRGAGAVAQGPRRDRRPRGARPRRVLRPAASSWSAPPTATASPPASGARG